MSTRLTIWAVLLSPFILAGTLAALSPSAASLDAVALAEGRWWTLWTGHFLHFTFSHAFWDWSVFLICLWLLRHHGFRLWAAAAVVLPVLSLATLLARPDLWEYRGLSGLDTVLFTLLCLEFLSGRRGRAAVVRLLGGAVPLLALGGKIVCEFGGGGAIFSGDLGPGNEAVPEIHLAGLLLGLLWFCAAVRPPRGQAPQKCRSCDIFVAEAQGQGWAVRGGPNVDGGRLGPRRSGCG